MLRCSVEQAPNVEGMLRRFNMVRFRPSRARCCTTVSGAYASTVTEDTPDVELQGDAAKAAEAAAAIADFHFTLVPLVAAHRRIEDTAGPEARRLQGEAWEIIAALPDEHMDYADAAHTMRVLKAFQFFSKFWERGVDGPAAAPDGDASAPREVQPELVRGSRIMPSRFRRGRQQSASPRHDPLGDMIE
jgi:hypothetical protein